MSTRYIPNNPADLLRPDPLPNLISSLTSLTRTYPPQHTWPKHLSGLYSGPTSIALLFLHLSRSHPTLAIDHKTPTHWCTAYLRGTRHVSPVDPDHCGVANEQLAYYAVQAAFTEALNYVEKLVEVIPSLLTRKGGSNEWLYGRTGLLYLLRLVRHFVPASAELVAKPSEQLISCILSQGPPWSWHGKEYLGAVHGDMGIIAQIVLASPKYAAALQPRLSELLDLQDHDGNWPSSVPSAHRSNPLVQFCHGAPGFVISLVAIEKHFASLRNRVRTAIARGRDCVWARGVLTKDPCLCHGTTGNALALEPGGRSAHFLGLTTAQERGKMKRDEVLVEGDDPFGLFCGEAGRAWGWVVLDTGVEAGMVGFTDV